jgi:hypothetical protein
MRMAKFVIFDSQVLGRVVEDLEELTPKVLEATACGADGVLFVRTDGSFGVEDLGRDDLAIVSAKSEKAALKKWNNGDE